MAERLSLLRKSLLILACRAMGLPVVLHLHAAQLHHFYRSLPTPLKTLTRWVFGQADACVVLGESSRGFVTQELAVAQARVHVLINGVPEPTCARRQPGAVQRVLFVGNLSRRKGVQDFLDALASAGLDRQLTEVQLAGGGDVRAYRRRARALGLQGWVHFEGWASQSRVSELMAQADVLVLPSYDEGLPLVILEALSHGLAVICTPVGEIGSTLQDGQQALFVPPGDVQALAAQLRRLLGDAALREHLERQGRAMYEAQFSMRRFFEGVARIHLQVFGTCASLAARAMPAPVPGSAAAPEPALEPRKEVA
jgi:glycosyltransferase involved in cell wall biosynthesis